MTLFVWRQEGHPVCRNGTGPLLRRSAIPKVRVRDRVRVRFRARVQHVKLNGKNLRVKQSEGYAFRNVEQLPYTYYFVLFAFFFVSIFIFFVSFSFPSTEITPSRSGGMKS